MNDYEKTDWGLDPGTSIVRTELHRLFGGRPQGGIGPSRKSPNVLLFTDPAVGEQHGYFDGWQPDGSFHYTGEGQLGDQRMASGNKAILRHEQEGRKLRMFRGARGTVEYMDEFQLDDDEPFFETEAPETGNGPMRKVIIFNLWPVTTESGTPSGAPTRAEGLQIETVPIEEQYTERSTVSPDREPYETERREAKLVRAFRDYLRGAGHKVVRFKIKPDGELRAIYTDVYDETLDMMLEAKGGVTREEFRMAIGQLADYCRFRSEANKGILVPERPRDDLMALAASQGITVVWPENDGYEAEPALPW